MRHIVHHMTGGIKRIIYCIYATIHETNFLTCSPFSLRRPLGRLLHLGFLSLFASFFFVVASSVFVFLLAEVVVLLVAAKVV